MKSLRGFTLLNALIALLVFTFGVLSLAGAYLRLNANLGDNDYFTSAGVLAESMRSTLLASPKLLLEMEHFNSEDSQTNSAFIDWTAQLTEAMPQGKAIATGVTPSGAICTEIPPCAVTLTISWQKKIKHEQTFMLQIGY